MASLKSAFSCASWLKASVTMQSMENKNRSEQVNVFIKKRGQIYLKYFLPKTKAHRWNILLLRWTSLFEFFTIPQLWYCVRIFIDVIWKRNISNQLYFHFQTKSIDLSLIKNRTTKGNIFSEISTSFNTWFAKVFFSFVGRRENNNGCYAGHATATI